MSSAGRKTEQPLPWKTGRKDGRKGKWPVSRMWMVALVVINVVLMALATLIRFTTPQVVLTPLAYVRPVDLSTTNICQRIDAHILSVTRTPTEPVIAQFDSRVVALDTYMTRVMLRLPKYSQGKHDKKFIATLHALKRLTVDWCNGDGAHTVADADVLKAKLVAFRPQFAVIATKKFKPPPLWYMHIARISYGLTEGVAAPVLACAWVRDKAMDAMAFGRRRRARPVGDWRRDSLLFAISRLYGAIVCGFLVMAAAQWTKFAPLFVVAMLALLYGTISFASYCTSYAERIDDWVKPRMEEFFRHFSFGLDKQSKSGGGRR